METTRRFKNCVPQVTRQVYNRFQDPIFWGVGVDAKSFGVKAGHTDRQDFPIKWKNVYMVALMHQ